ncbi:hypothetical protein SAMN05421743_12139 [Thalassobacillus cyri]|uniref:DUF3168 domain-containing protein n=1 Tax=Thalassobacillus cyri TaxID=571932 RepID=A0A1H4H1Y0_9BACI|nr:hypothetical protein [Thalassobacillus cyri]SEB15756.1 hypothetical protein SAMN05421743_12139 [Thalassobacillus cyri]
MNEKAKAYMAEQQERLVNDLNTTFTLPVFVDEAAEDELPADNNYFLIVYGDMTTASKEGNLSQEVYVVYISEGNPDIEATTLDIISVGTRVRGISFSRTIKERVQKGETTDFFDRVTLIFRRILKHEYSL